MNDIDTLHPMWINPDVRHYLWDDAIIDRAFAAEVVESSIEVNSASGSSSSKETPPAMSAFVSSTSPAMSS
jgi:hypothetical protein